MRSAWSRREAARTAALELRALGRRDADTAVAFLGRQPVRDLFIASRIVSDGALGPPGWSPIWGAFDLAGRLRGILHLGPNLVPAVDDLAVLDELARLATGPGPTRMLVGERQSVERLWQLIGGSYPAPREVRARQFVYALDPRALAVPSRGAPPGRARLARRGDEERVLALSAAMYLEEMGEDPLARDAAGYRRRVRVLTDRGWTFVYELDGELVFKMDVGCASQHGAQIQGVYVPPGLRGRGLGTHAMGACCALAFQRHPALSLYVNDFNRPAVALYERLGFRRQPFDFQTIMLP
jgi:ribosomal protein S18 acetylase RimI-like enzyme